MHVDGTNPFHHSLSGKARIITYDKSNGTTSLKKHVSNHHPQEVKKWIVDIKANKKMCTKHVKRRHAQALLPSIFGYAKPYHKNDHFQWAFLEDLALYIAKSHRLLSIVEDAWLKQLVLQ
jgi:hypothetical protein